MRWADLDSLGHINNVVYVDYLQEARVSLLRAMLPERRGDLTEGTVVVRHEVTYLAPLSFRFRPVSVEVWVTAVRAATFTLAYEVFHEDDGVRTVYLRATTVLTPYVFDLERPRRLAAEEKEALAPYVEEAFGEANTKIPPLDRSRAHRFPLHVRFSDVDAYRHVNNVKYFEYFQEARVRHMADLTRGSGFERPAFVVAQTDVDYRLPILMRQEPYDVWSAIIRGRHPLDDDRVRDRRRRPPAGPGAGDRGVLRPGHAALGHAERRAARAVGGRRSWVRLVRQAWTSGAARLTPAC